MIEIIPAIDVIDGKCVRLSQGDFNRKREYGDPVEMARMFEDHGLKRLHLVDLDGAREKRVVNYRLLEKIAVQTDLVIDAGGGIRSNEDVRKLFESGAQMITGGSIAVNQQSLFLSWLAQYGPERIILGADFRDGKVAISGWKESSDHDLLEFTGEYLERGIRKVICTDINRDGMLEGPSLEVYRSLKGVFDNLHLIASGGISSMKDIRNLDKAGLEGVIVGKAIYEGKINMKSLETYIIENN